MPHPAVFLASFRGSFCPVLVAMVALPSLAAESFGCGGADVRIEVLARDSAIPDERAEGVLTVARNGAETILRYRSIDYIGGQCVTARDARQLVVFQAYCGGSGCMDRENWGVIDPTTLRVLVVPGDASRKDAVLIVGGAALPALKMMNVIGEAERQGVRVP